MNEQSVRAALQHYIDHSSNNDEDRASEIYHHDAILEFPQSGERFEGVENLREWRRLYPAKVRRGLGAPGMAGPLAGHTPPAGP